MGHKLRGVVTKKHGSGAAWDTNEGVVVRKIGTGVWGGLVGTQTKGWWLLRNTKKPDNKSRRRGVVVVLTCSDRRSQHFLQRFAVADKDRTTPTHRQTKQKTTTPTHHIT